MCALWLQQRAGKLGLREVEPVAHHKGDARAADKAQGDERRALVRRQGDGELRSGGALQTTRSTS